MGALGDRMRNLLKYGDLWLVGALFGTILVLILPVVPFMLDLLLTISIAASLLILLVILYLRYSGRIYRVSDVVAVYYAL